MRKSVADKAEFVESSESGESSESESERPQFSNLASSSRQEEINH